MKILIVGLGSIGSRHAANVTRIPGLKAAVFDPAPGRAEYVGTRMDLEYFSNWQSALDWEPEAAVVAVPTSQHIPIARELVEIGANILVEKPISNRIDGVDAFLCTAEKRGLKVYVVCNMRFHPAIKALKKAISEIGKPFFARAHYGYYLPNMRPGADYRDLYCSRRETGGGVILDAIHEVDYLSWIFGPVEAVFCEAAKLSDLNIDVEDYAHLIMRHATGIRSEIHLDYLTRIKRRGLEVVGSEGSVIWLSEGKIPENCNVKQYTVEGGLRIILDEATLDASRMYLELMENFIAAINGGEDSMLLDGRTACIELTTAFAAHRSAEVGRIISVRK